MNAVQKISSITLDSNGDKPQSLAIVEGDSSEPTAIGEKFVFDESENENSKQLRSGQLNSVTLGSNCNTTQSLAIGEGYSNKPIPNSNDIDEKSGSDKPSSSTGEDNSNVGNPTSKTTSEMPREQKQQNTKNAKGTDKKGEEAKTPTSVAEEIDTKQKSKGKKGFGLSIGKLSMVAVPLIGLAAAKKYYDFRQEKEKKNRSKQEGARS